jgi:putative ABC transport system substrate-binding protein
MRRRDFIGLTAGAAVAWPLATRAQPAAMPVVGFVRSTTLADAKDLVTAFRQGLAETGYTDGQNVTVEYRWADGDYTRVPALAADLIRRQVLVIAAGGTGTARDAKAATTTIPIVFVTADDPVDNGLVGSLNRPGGNVTGVSLVSAELRPKMFQLLRELVPQAKLIHMLSNPNNASIEIQTKETKAAAAAAGFQLKVQTASTPDEIDAAFAKFSQERGALLVASDPFLTGRHRQIAALSVRHAIPGVYPWREFAQAGGLMSYGSSLFDGYRQVGVYTGRILKGEKPGDLPVQQPTKFELVINLKTAKALGLDVPPTMLTRADEVIE